MTLTIDCTNMMATALRGSGITDAEWADAQEAFRGAHARVNALRDDGTLGFLGLPTNTAAVDATMRVADNARGRFDDVLLLGIGGSALGPIALRSALRPPSWNALDGSARDG